MAKPLKPSDLKQSAKNIKTRFVAISWRDLAISFGPIALLVIFSIWLAIKFIHPAPPNSLTIATGAENSSFWKIAEKYRLILARNGIKLKIVSSQGSLDNLRKLSDPDSGIDVGFVQGGVVGHLKIDGLVSLGSISYVPVSVFYRNLDHRNSSNHSDRLDRLSELRGKRIAIGAPGSGSRVLALTLLKANDIEIGGSTELLDMGGDEAAQALTDGKIDAAFLMGDSASPPTMIKLLHTPGINLLDFSQAGAYSRRFSYLNELKIPEGLFDFGKNIPSRDIHLIAPTAELIAHDDLHPALSDMLIDAAKEVHSGTNVLQHAGEFPAPLVHEFPISDDATRYYKSGKSFFYRSGLPFWLASLIDRTLVVLLPIILLLIPAFKLVPLLYGWRIKSRIYRWYGALITLERAIAAEEAPEELMQRLDHIEEGVNRMKMPLAFADQFYVLREHISFVRSRLLNKS